MTWRIVLYLVLLTLVTILLALLQQAINLKTVNIALPQLAPATSFLILAPAFKDLRTPVTLVLTKTIASRSLIALMLPPLIFSIVFVISKSLGLEMELTFDFNHLILPMLPGILIGATGEEIGWRSFLQPMLERKHSPLLASIITGLAWGLWHMGHYANGLRFMMGFLIFTVSASIVLARILRGTTYSIIVSVFFHASVNICFLIFFRKSLSSAAPMIVVGITWLIVVIGFMILSKGFVRLGRSRSLYNW